MTPQEFCERYCVDRLGTDSLKWDALESRFGDPDLTAMWVADMEFQAPPQVLEAMTERVRHGVFGYSYTPDAYYQAVEDWHRVRHGSTVSREWLRFAPGVVAALYWLIGAFTRRSDSVIILTPVYYPFRHAVRDNGRNLVMCDLENDGTGRYAVNLERFEQEIIDNQVKLYIHCSPHNPVGRVWTEEEQRELFGICRRHGVLVISDEIHMDVVPGSRRHVPALQVDGGAHLDNLILVTAPSKTFNLAGLLHAHVFIPDDTLRGRYDAHVKTVNSSECNIMGVVSTQAAYQHGAPWLEDMLGVVRHNRDLIRDALAQSVPGAVVSELEGTYLLWVDLRGCIPPGRVKEVVQDQCRLAVDFGEWFGDAGKGFIRLNLGTHVRNAEFAAEQLAKYLAG